MQKKGFKLVAIFLKVGILILGAGLYISFLVLKSMFSTENLKSMFSTENLKSMFIY